MGGTSVLAAAVTAALCVALSPVLARWVLSAPDPANRFWWLPRREPVPSAALLVACATVGAVTGGLCGFAAGWGAALPGFAVLAMLMVPLAIIDIRVHRLPDRLTAAAAIGVGGLLVLAAAGAPSWGDTGRAVLGGAAALTALGLLRIAVPSGLGFGDVKLGGVLGLALGWHSWGAVLAGLVAGFVLGAGAALVLLGARRATLRTAVAFGPSLILGALLVCAAAGSGL